MITCKLQGGLGNELFQIAATIGTARKLGTDYVIPPWRYSHCFSELNIGNVNLPEYKETSFEYSPIEQDNICLNGYFQSEKYFDESLRRILKPKKRITYLRGNNCAIHVRMGDYLSLTDYHYNLSLDYYRQASLEIGKRVKIDKFIVFSDDIEWCQKQPLFRECLFVSEGTGDRSDDDVKDFFIMAKCRNFIIANSSFSWWASWLSGSENIIAPKNWFGEKKKHLNTQDLYTDKMIVI